MSSKKQISVRVPKTERRNQSIAEFKWNNQTISPQLDRVEEEVSKRLFSDGRVLTILKRAFELGLSRYQAWDVSEVDPDATPAFRIAADVFKRGVPVTDRRIAVKPQRKSIITYDVEIVSRVSDCFIKAGDGDIIIVDQNVAKIWWRDLPQGFVSVPFSEASKSIMAVSAVADIIRGRRSLDSKIFVVGGGVAGDVVGFAAGILGVSCQYIPTTLLSMADSSIGGKVGVNFEPWGKNQVGLFHHPHGVYIWPGWLETLEDKEIKSGLVECLKHVLIAGDLALWAAMTKPGNHLKLSNDFLGTIIQVKRDVVERDPFEDGERAVLNFGHTLGHAMETVAAARGVAVTHGECVAIGMIHALRLSVKYRGMIAGSFILDLFKSNVVMPKTTLIELNDGEDKPAALAKELIELMSRDKKAAGKESVSFVLIDAPGQISREKDSSWVIQFSRRDALRDLEDTLSFLLTLSY
jgi:3-dehydroquinate synthase